MNDKPRTRTATRNQDSYLPEVKKIPPQSIDAEMGILCSVLNSPDTVLPECKSRINPEYFYYPANKIIYSEILSLNESGKPIDFITLTQSLKDKGELEKAGGAAKISETFTFVTTTINFDYYIDIIAEKYALRKLVEATMETNCSAYSYQGPISGIVDDLKKKISEIEEVAINEGGTDDLDTKNLLMEFVKEVEARKRGEVSPYMPSFLQKFNDDYKGFLFGEYILLQGYPGCGKTAFLINQAVHVCINLGLPAVIFAQEMKGTRLISRMVSYMTGISGDKIDSGDLSEIEINKFTRAVGQLSKSPLHIYDNQKSISSDMVVRRCEKLHRKYGKLGLVGVDYLQILSNLGDEETREREVAKDSLNMKRVCAMGATTFVLTQLNDKGATRESRAPFQDCDDCFEIKKTNNRYEREIVCKKRRNAGESDWTWKCLFDGKTTSFRDPN